MLANFFQLRLHQKILLIAFPMILSNITTPLMGLVDTAILGHMQGTHFLAGASIAALVITQLYWVCGFLRMTSTGLSAQEKGKQDKSQLGKSLLQGLTISLVLTSFLLLSSQQILQLGIYFANTSQQIEAVMTEYFNVRIWGAPAAMANLAINGWLIGQQKVKQVLVIQVVGNVLNIVLNIVFVMGLDLNVFGVALATVFAEYFICVCSLWVAFTLLTKTSIRSDWFSLAQLKPLVALNGNTFIRNLMLQACIAFLIFHGVGYGTSAAAINAIIMQFFTLIALGLDGVAFAAEALVGEKKGQKDATGIMQVTVHGLMWSSLLAIAYSLVFYLFGSDILTLLTDQVELSQAMNAYWVIVLWLPIIAHWCFFFDGVFVGLTRAKAMRNSMIFSTVLIYFPVFLLLSDQQNQGLWIAMLLFLFSRGMTLGGYFTYLYRRNQVAV